MFAFAFPFSKFRQTTCRLNFNMIVTKNDELKRSKEEPSHLLVVLRRSQKHNIRYLRGDTWGKSCMYSL